MVFYIIWPIVVPVKYPMAALCSLRPYPPSTIIYGYFTGTTISQIMYTIKCCGEIRENFENNTHNAVQFLLANDAKRFDRVQTFIE